jgi:hypothetical protein
MDRARESSDWIEAIAVDLDSEETKLHRDGGGAPVRASAWPVCAAKDPGLPSSSSIGRVSGRRPEDERQMNPPGVYQLRTEAYHTGIVNVL